MALPALTIGQTVTYYPTFFDTGALNFGTLGRVAAIVTFIDTVNNLVSLSIFPAGKPMDFRTGIKYYTDIDPRESFFLLVSDPDPDCIIDKSGQSITDTAFESFTASWTNPGSFSGTNIFYRVTGTTPWFAVNNTGNAVGHFSTLGTDFIFDSGLVAETEYDVLIVNICPNGLASAGVIATGITDTAL